MANAEISQALGIHIQEFDEIKDAEVIECRRDVFRFILECYNERNCREAESQALYKFPPEIENSPYLPSSMETKLDKGAIKVNVYWHKSFLKQCVGCIFLFYFNVLC